METVLQSTSDGILVAGLSGEILTVNKRFFEMCRIPEQLRQTDSAQQLIDCILGTLLHPQVFQIELERLNQCNEESWKIIELKDGCFLEAYSRPVFLDSKLGRLWSIRDATERKRMESDLSESQAYNRCLFANSSIPLVVLDPATGRFIDCNAAAVVLYGFQSREDVLGKAPVDVSTEIQYDGTLSGSAASEHIRLSLEKGSHNFEWRHRRPNGEVWDAEVQLMRFEYRQHAYLQFSLLDVTQRNRIRHRDVSLGKLNENLLLPNSLTNKMKLITDAVVDILEADFARIWLINPGDRCSVDCLYTRVTEGPHICRNRQRCLHLTSSSDHYTHLSGENQTRIPMGSSIIGALAVGEESRFVSNDVAGDPRVHHQDWIRLPGLSSFAGFRLQTAEGSPPGVLALFRRHPITAEDEALIESLANTASLVCQTAQTMETLRRSEDKFARAFRASPDALIISRVADGVIVDVNQVFCLMTGHRREEILGMTALSIDLWDNPDDRNKFVQALKTEGRLLEAEYRFRTKSRQLLDCLVTSEVIYIGDDQCAMSIIRDITEHKKAEMELLREKEFTEKLLESLPGIFFLYDSTCHLKRWNKAHETSMGFTTDELRDWYIPDWHETPEDAAKGMALVKSVLETGVGGAFETTLINKQGRFIPYVISITRLLTPDGSFMMGVGIDITERKKAETELMQEKEFTEKLLESLPGIFFLYDSTCHLKRWNKAHETSMGYTADELRGWYIPDWHETPEDAAKGMALVKSVLETGVGGAFETTLINKQGHFVPYLISITRLMTPDGSFMMGVGIDITNRKKMEEALSVSEKRFRSIALNLPGVVYQLYVRPNGEMGFRFVSDRALDLLGLDRLPDDLFAHFTQGIPPQDQQRFLESIQKAIQEVTPWEYEGYFIQASGKQLFIRVMSQPEKLENEVIFYGVLLDVTDRRRAEEERKLAEEALRTSQFQLSQAVDLAHIVYWECDPKNGTFIFNDPFYAFYRTTASVEDGYVMGMNDFLRRFVHPEDVSYIQEAIAQNEASPGLEFPADIEHRMIRRDGEIRHVITRIRMVRDATGSLVRVFGANQDITERKAMEEERRSLELRLFQSQKMESLGTLTGGIAHDFNNILTALMGYGSLLQLTIDEKNPLRVYVDEIMSAAQMAADLTQSLLAFSRQKPVTFSTVKINERIRGAEKLLKRLVTEDVAIKTDLTADDPVIVADATQVDQVFFNLAANARDAMPNGGTFTITTRVVELDDTFLRVHGFGEPGKYAMISITDTGQGMDKETMGRIFDPFFTTKEVGKGTGLGLSTVYGIVKQHSGHIMVYSEPKVGTTFHIYFPIVDKIAEKEIPSAKPVRGGEETILIAEDNEPARRLIKNILTQYGYTIVEAMDGMDAVEQFKKAERIDLLVLDSVMPKKNGREAYNEINEIKPGIKVLFTSGYTRDFILNKGIEDKKFHFISKPIQPFTLLNKVREILDEHRN